MEATEVRMAFIEACIVAIVLFKVDANTYGTKVVASCAGVTLPSSSASNRSRVCCRGSRALVRQYGARELAVRWLARELLKAYGANALVVSLLAISLCKAVIAAVNGTRLEVGRYAAKLVCKPAAVTKFDRPAEVTYGTRSVCTSAKVNLAPTDT